MVARIEATTLGLDIRYVVTSLSGTVKYLYETVYCGRGQAENFIKLHKRSLPPIGLVSRPARQPDASDLAHGCLLAAAHLACRRAKRSLWASAEFNTLRLRLIKIAARVVEAAARIRVWLPTDAQTPRCSRCSPAASPPDRERRGTRAPMNPSRNP